MYLDKFWFEEMLKKIMERFDRIDEKLKAKKQEAQPLDGDRLLDNQDLCQLLGVTKRTVARYRQKKLIRYYTIRGKVWYKASELTEFQRKGNCKPDDRFHRARMLRGLRPLLEERS